MRNYRPAERFLLAVFVVALVGAPAGAWALFSLPTGPSEKGAEVPVAAPPPKAFPGTAPAGVKMLADREYQAALETEIAAARSEIMLVTHLFNATDTPADRPRAIIERLAAAAGRGVKVEVILEIGWESAAATRANREAARMLTRRGVTVSADGSGTTVHAGFVVVDRRLVFIGSHQLTEPSLGQFREVSLLVDSPALAAALLGQAASLKPVPLTAPPPRRPVRPPPPRTSRRPTRGR